MSIDFSPVFYTVTMVKILRDQGSRQHAMELAELILEQNPQHAEVLAILAELKEEARQAFERFKSAGKPAESKPAPETSRQEAEPVPEAKADLEDPIVEPKPSREPVKLTLIESPAASLTPRERKIRRLEALLQGVQNYRSACNGRDL